MSPQDRANSESRNVATRGHQDEGDAQSDTLKQTFGVLLVLLFWVRVETAHKNDGIAMCIFVVLMSDYVHRLF